MKTPPVHIIYEDAEIVAIDKPAGLLSVHTRLEGRTMRESQTTAENLLTWWVRKGQAKSSKRVWPVHRLDRETSGVMMFAKSEKLADAIRDRWNELTSKEYCAIVAGEMESPSGKYVSYLAEDPRTFRVFSVENPADGKKAVTEWTQEAARAGRSFVRIRLKSGRKHQIRVQFAEAGHPVVGDRRYGGAKAPRMFLHSSALSFTHPDTGKKFEWQSPCPFSL